MNKYLIAETGFSYDTPLKGVLLAEELADLGFYVDIWLLQDAVLAPIEDVLYNCMNHSNITCYIDRLSLHQRGIEESFFKNMCIDVKELGCFSKTLMKSDVKTIWH